MAFESSALHRATNADLLNAHYGLSVTAVQKMKLGTANCYRVCSGEKRYFLKEFQSRFQEVDLLREAKLANYLAEHGIPTARFILTDHGEPFLTVRGHLVCLEEYIDGIPYGYNDFPEKLLQEEAAMLGKLHQALAGYELPVGMAGEWLNAFSAEKAMLQYDTLLAELEKHRNDQNYEKIKSDLIYKKDLISRADELAGYYAGVTYSPSHGDYQGCQLICGEDHIKAVIDFSSAKTLPVVWEIMRSYVQSSARCRDQAKIDIAGLCGYVGEYMKYSPLTETDLKAMPYVYLFQLARSKYGYNEYLTTDSEDRGGLLQFAFWRTDMCREVDSKAKMIAEALAGLKRDIS